MPIYKVGDRLQPASFRPVSVQCCRETHRETCKRSDVQLFNGKLYVADTIRVQTPSFHGECCCAVDLISTIASHGEEKRVTCLTSSDPSKAFDSVDRNEPFKKLGWYAGAQPGGGGSKGSAAPPPRNVWRGPLLHRPYFFVGPACSKKFAVGRYTGLLRQYTLLRTFLVSILFGRVRLDSFSRGPLQ